MKISDFNDLKICELLAIEGDRPGFVAVTRGMLEELGATDTDRPMRAVIKAEAILDYERGDRS